MRKGTVQRSVLAVVTSLSATTVVARADELHVPSEYATIQAAVDAAEHHDIIWVAPGIYSDPFDSLGKRVVIQSEQGPEATILDGAGAGPIATFSAGEGGGELRGFTLRNARLNTPGEVGAAVRVHEADAGAVLEDNLFENNEAQNGAAIGCTDSGAVFVMNNEFRFNRAHAGGAAIWKYKTYAVVLENEVRENWGGAIVSTRGGGTLRDNEFHSNRGGMRGGAVQISETGNWRIERNRFENNEAFVSGGALSFDGISAHQVLDNDFVGNQSGDGGAIAIEVGGTFLLELARNRISNNTAVRGGGVFFIRGFAGDTSNVVASNLFEGNRAQVGAQAWFCACGNGGPVEIVRNTFVQTDASPVPMVHLETDDYGELVFNGNIVRAAEGGVGIHCPAPSLVEVDFRYNCVWAPGGEAYSGACQDPTGTEGNISVPPGFRGPLDGDYRLALDSPCLDAGDPTTPWHGLDVEGSPWPQDADFDGSFLVDIGAFELSHVQLDVEGTPELGNSLTLRARGMPGMNAFFLVGYRGSTPVTPPFGPLYQRLDTRLVIIDSGPLPLETSWVVHEGVHPLAVLAIQALVRGTTPGTGNSSNPFVFRDGQVIPE